MPLWSFRIQEKGQVTIPREIRTKLNLKKGDMVVFIETENGIIIQPAEAVIDAALNEVGDGLRNRISLSELIRRGRAIRGDLIKEEYGLSAEPE